jgi:replicative DNA helicase
MSAAERSLPTNLDAERFVLGSILLDDNLMHSARPVLNSGDFGLERHSRIWQRACEVYDTGGHVDRVTVANALMQAGELESCGGLTYLVSLDDGIPLCPDLGSYVRIVQDKAILRRVIYAARSIEERCFGGHETPQAILNGLGATLQELTPRFTAGGLVSTAELVERVGINQILAPRIERGLPFPWEWMNDNTCGMLPDELWILAGHTGTGKTSAALQTAVGIANRGKGVAMFSLEMGPVSLYQRAVWQWARVDAEQAKKNKLTPDHRERVREAAEAIRNLPLYFDDTSLTTTAIHAALRQRSLQNPIAFVVVDYLQLLGPSGRHENRAHEVGANARALKLLASEFKCPVLLLSQFSRESTKPGKKRKPELSDLKESGDIECHANGVWFIHRESEKDASRVPVEFILPKQRDGRRNVSWNFVFRPEFQAFEQPMENE